jgi:2-succinyl-5-enolpyruvyl-6-hydroxy-3-cyclohexene-1-carboxylate synthase
MNNLLAHSVIREAINCGVIEFCICPGARNSPFIFALENHPHISLETAVQDDKVMQYFELESLSMGVDHSQKVKATPIGRDYSSKDCVNLSSSTAVSRIRTYFWFEERSAAFFALGRSKISNRPVAVITTSGTAAAELLPATMEAYYTGAPLLLITADRPRRFRGTGAPQTAEQVGLFGCYASFCLDLAFDESCDLSTWSRQQPAHLNICFEEPNKSGIPFVFDFIPPATQELAVSRIIDPAPVDAFLERVNYPLVVVSTLRPESREPVCAFLEALNAPVLLEAPSGLREDPRLAHLRVTNPEKILDTAAKSGYPIDGILRIGGVPTNRLWRDLEDLEGKVGVCSINDHPFSGLSWGNIIHGDISTFFSHYHPPASKLNSSQAGRWLESDRQFHQSLLSLFAEEPYAEASLIHALSHQIPSHAMVYLGNSLPIREWDLAASLENKELSIYASRGLNGIDGQISTFLGYCSADNENWTVLGDLTALYDMAGPWILSQLNNIHATIVIINNSGGQIFNRMFSSQAFLNSHEIQFAPFASLWGLSYERWTTIPERDHSKQNRLIEIVPDPDATARFWKKLAIVHSDILHPEFPINQSCPCPHPITHK